MINNEKGITLMEVLATLVLLSIIGLIAWNVFFQGTKYSNIELKKTQMQQEVNYINSKLTDIHIRNETYQIDIAPDSCSFSVLYGGSIDEFKHRGYCINIESYNSPTLLDNPINQKDIDLKLKISDKSNLDNYIEVDIFLHKL
ncbi:PulJ/GspJ family protein [Lysinibacillus endophyticus]|uniref:PulJ/GspJ family protein n=1 Tax=Ureibacillus endophyticus TaxID=1978490 RepID=UPI00209F93B5|nr:prepilin-type N-terminal cleavage/methylation domain-containing protein [Lysinibacillus endophyticus]MCP1144173.1 prepilin-type N-terminal cleavage/methylation domain-containing protein [Lysinibacillus endophyticus]